jgi:hypothetical protein
MDDQRTDREGGVNAGSLKSSEQIVSKIADTIVGIHERPHLYVGSTTRPGDADRLHILLHELHSLWAFAQNREKEFVAAYRKLGDKYFSGPLAFAGAFRKANPDKEEAAASAHVLYCWAEIDSLLGIPIPKNLNPTH